MTPRKRHAKGSDKSLCIPLTCKVSVLQLQLINDVIPTGMSTCEWLRLAAVSAAYHERGRIMLEAAAGTAPTVTQQDIEAVSHGR